MHSTTRNAPCVHPRLDSILELSQAFPIAQALCLSQWNALLRSKQKHFYECKLLTTNASIIINGNHYRI